MQCLFKPSTLGSPQRRLGPGEHDLVGLQRGQTMELGVAEFSRVVSRLHLGASDANPWDDTFADITHCLGATACSLAVSTEDDPCMILATTISPEAAAAYSAYYHKLDFVVDDSTRGPTGLVRSGWDLVRKNERTEFHADWQRPFEMTDGIHVRLAAPRPTTFVISAPPSDQPFATTERIRFVDALIPHLQHVLHTRHYLAPEQTPLHGGNAIDAIRHGIIVLDATGHIVDLNTAAHTMIKADDGLTIRARRLRLDTPSAQHELDFALLQAGPHPKAHATRRGSHLICGRPSGRLPYVLHVTPLHAERNVLPTHTAVVIVDASDIPKPRKELLNKMFGLTKTEIEVTLRLLDGTGLAAISDDMALSLATVKTHVHNIFGKTHTHRQAQLIRLLTAFIS